MKKYSTFELNLLKFANMYKMKRMIDSLIAQKANGNTFQELNVQMKLVLKGIPVQKITEETPDDLEIIGLINETAKDFNIQLDVF